MLHKRLKFLRLSAPASFDQITNQEEIFLYAGDIGSHTKKGPIPFIGLSLNKSNRRHIKHDVRSKLPLTNDSVSIYQSEDVFEHVAYEELLPIINEIFRVLKPGGLFRLSLPDYRCDILNARTQKDSMGKMIFDPGGGGSFQDGKVKNGGHLWFPIFELVDAVMRQSNFMSHGRINFMHYYDTNSKSITNKIDHTKGLVIRTPDFDKRVQSPHRAMSIVVDAYKSEVGL